MSFAKQSRWLGRGWSLAALCAATAIARPVHAQIDTNPPLQNVMLLVDTSGSMEYASNGAKVSCDEVDASLPSEPKGASQKTRWTQLVEVLTGDVQQFSCYSQDRRSGAFASEYQIGGINPYDYKYQVPYHRIVSGSGASRCTVGAGVLDPNPFSWGTTPFKYHAWDNASASCTGFLQAETGLLDTYRDRMRFGLMTFDGSVDAGTGLTGPSSPNYTTGNAGNWSYFLDCAVTPTARPTRAARRAGPSAASPARPWRLARATPPRLPGKAAWCPSGRRSPMSAPSAPPMTASRRC